VTSSITGAATTITSPFRGVTHYHRVEPAGTLVPREVVMDIVAIERTAPGVGFLTTPGNGSAPGEFTAQTTSQFVQQHNLQIGLNGDFFSFAGTGPNGESYRDVTNLAASNGALISPWPASPGTVRGALNISSANVPTLVRPASGSGGTFNTNPVLTPYNAIGGSDRMIDNGVIVLTSAFANEVHPRTVVGYNTTHVFLFTVDGRQEGYSMGMNLHEIANLLKNDYGVTHALNLDGGGSTTMVMADPTVRVVNRPSDPGRVERLNGNNLGVFAGQWPQWNVNSSGNWSTASNWSQGVPNAAGAAAKFGRIIGAPRTVTVNAAATVGTLAFENANAYTLAGTSAITLDSTAGNAAVRAYVGSHTINAPLTLADTVDVDVLEPNRTLSINSALNNAAGRTINKLGAGAVAISGAQTHGAGAVLNVNAGVLSMASNAGGAAGTAANLSVNVNGSSTAGFVAKQNLSALAVNGTASAYVAPGGGKTIKTRTLAIATAAKLDLADNNLVVDYTGATSPLGTANTSGVYSGISGLLQRGRGVDGSWINPGLYSTRAAASNSVKALAIAEAADVLFITGTQTALWSGQTVDATSVLVMYTYDGDTNLDGLIDVADYGSIDNWIQFPGTTGYTNGDFNLDGVIDVADYGVIDNTIQLQGPPITATAAAASAAVTPVPEPSAVAAVTTALAVLSARRRRPRPCSILRPQTKTAAGSAAVFAKTARARLTS
jgi:hypothetical protein